MRSQSKAVMGRSTLATVSWTLVCCLVMATVLAVITSS